VTLLKREEEREAKKINNVTKENELNQLPQKCLKIGAVYYLKYYNKRKLDYKGNIFGSAVPSFLAGYQL